MQVFWRVVVLVLVAATASVAQVERASIVGSVTDNTGAVLPGVQVKVTNEATNTSVTGQTDSAGAYSVVNLTPGTYTIEAEKGGFSRRVQRGLLLQVAQTAAWIFSFQSEPSSSQSKFGPMRNCSRPKVLQWGR